MKLSVSSNNASTIPAPPQPTKQCACGREYDAYAWATLPYVGVQDCISGEALELRNCPAPCMSTLSVRIR